MVKGLAPVPSRRTIRFAHLTSPWKCFFLGFSAFLLLIACGLWGTRDETKFIIDSKKNKILLPLPFESITSTPTLISALAPQYRLSIQKKMQSLHQKYHQAQLQWSHEWSHNNNPSADMSTNKSSVSGKLWRPTAQPNESMNSNGEIFSQLTEPLIMNSSMEAMEDQRNRDQWQQYTMVVQPVFWYWYIPTELIESGQHYERHEVDWAEHSMDEQAFDGRHENLASTLSFTESGSYISMQNPTDPSQSFPMVYPHSQLMEDWQRKATCSETVYQRNSTIFPQIAPQISQQTSRIDGELYFYEKEEALSFPMQGPELHSAEDQRRKIYLNAAPVRTEVRQGHFAATAISPPISTPRENFMHQWIEDDSSFQMIYSDRNSVQDQANNPNFKIAPQVSTVGRNAAEVSKTAEDLSQHFDIAQLKFLQDRKEGNSSSRMMYPD